MDYYRTLVMSRYLYNDLPSQVLNSYLFLFADDMKQVKGTFDSRIVLYDYKILTHSIGLKNHYCKFFQKECK